MKGRESVRVNDRWTREREREIKGYWKGTHGRRKGGVKMRNYEGRLDEKGVER